MICPFISIWKLRLHAHLLLQDEDEVEDDPYQLPISHEVTLGSGHSKAVTCLDLDHSGSRLITGTLLLLLLLLSQETPSPKMFFM